MIKNKDLEQFANVVSHDLKEPIRTITSFVEIYKKQFSNLIEDDKGIEYLNIIEQPSSRMEHLINSLFDYTKIGWEPKTEKTDLNVLVENVLKDLSILIKDSKTSFIINELLILNVYPIELSTLFQNLISNAIKFKKENENPFFEISAFNKVVEWEFVFKDKGIGIAKEHY